MKKFTIILILLALTFSLLACGKSDSPKSDATKSDTKSETKSDTKTDAKSDDENPEVHVTFALMLADNHPHSVAARTVMAEEVSKRTGGKFTIDVQTNGALGSDAETTEATVMGNMYMTGPAAATLATINPNWYVLDVPYVFTSKEHVRSALDGELGQFLSNSLEESSGLICLGFGDSGMRGFSNNKTEVTSPDDMKDMKVRTLENKYHLATFSSLKTNPTPMAFSEVYTALQMGQIDAQDNPISITHTNKFFEVQKYYTKLEHLLSGNTYLVNAEWFNSLPESYQEILQDSVKKAVIKQRELVDSMENEQVAEMEEAGCVVTTLTVEQKQQFIDLTKSVRDDFVKEFGEDGEKMLELAEKANR